MTCPIFAKAGVTGYVRAFPRPSPHGDHERRRRGSEPRRADDEGRSLVHGDDEDVPSPGRDGLPRRSERAGVANARYPYQYPCERTRDDARAALWLYEARRRLGRRRVGEPALLEFFASRTRSRARVSPSPCLWDAIQQPHAHDLPQEPSGLQVPGDEGHHGDPDLDAEHEHQWQHPVESCSLALDATGHRAPILARTPDGCATSSPTQTRKTPRAERRR